MLTRRNFLLAAAGILVQPQVVFAKKKKPELRQFGPHTLSRQEWPPAIQPDFLSIVEKGYALLSDQSGRLAIVDLKHEGGPLVIGELTGIGKSIIDLATTQHRAYAIAFRDLPNGEGQYLLTTISITPPSDPSVMSQQPLSYFAEPVHIAANGDLVAVAGTGLNGENQIALHIMSHRRPDEANLPVATLGTAQPVAKLNIDDRLLVSLEPALPVSLLEFYSLTNPRSPQKQAALRLDGTYTVMARSREYIAVAGQNAAKNFELVLIGLRSAPHVVARASLPLNEVLDVALQKTQVLVLGNQDGRQSVVPVSFGKGGTLVAGSPVVLPAGAHGGASQAKIVAREREAYVVSDWGGVQVLDISKNGWQYRYSYTIPRLPAAAVAVAGSRAVLGGADLKVYDISNPAHPVALGTAELGSTVHSVAIDDDTILVLAHDTLSLRSLDKPGEVRSSVKVSGRTMTFDHATGRAYVIAPGAKTTIVYPFKIADTIQAQKQQELPGEFQDASADGGHLLAGGLNNLALFSIDDSVQSLAARTFPNFALRDLALVGTTAYVTAVDSASHGYLLAINTQKPDLPTIGSVDVPSDAVALAVAGNSAVVVGRGNAGKDVASIVDITNPPAPKVAASFPVIEAAAAVAIENKLALVAGRGLEVLTLA